MKLASRIMSLSAVATLCLGVSAVDDLDAFVRAQMAQRQINGLSLAIIQDGRIVEARAYGVTAQGGEPVTTSTLFQAGSISKPVAALGALRLVEQGRLSLDEDVNAKLTTWEVPANRLLSSERVTLRRLLSHTAGLTVHGFPGYDVNERMPALTEVLDGKGNTAPVRVDTLPGSIWRYSGGGYTVMQQLVIDVTGQPFPRFMSEAVLAPLGMSSSTYEQPLTPERAALTATGHWANRSPVPGRWHVYPEMAAAGLWTTPTDLARFAIEVQQSLAGTSSKVISQAMTRQMLTSQLNDFGLGLSLQGNGSTRRFGHNGRDAGFDAFMLAYAETGQGLVIMINANDNSGSLNRIVQFVARKYGWPDFPLPTPAAERRSTAPIALDLLAGRYELSNNNMLTLVARDGSLYSDVNGLPDEEFAFMDTTGGYRFGSTQRNFIVRFTTNAAGEVSGFVGSLNAQERIVPRIGPLFESVRPAGDPDPTLTQAVERTLRAWAQGGESSLLAPGVAAGTRAVFGSRPVADLAGFKALSYLATYDVAGRGIERHGSPVARVLYYQLQTEAGNRWLLIHVTADKLIADYDVVDK